MSRLLGIVSRKGPRVIVTDTVWHIMLKQCLTWFRGLSTIETMNYRIQQLFIYASLVTIAALTILMIVNRVQAVDNYECRVTRAQVQPFDTMWSIAEDNCDGNVRNVVHDMIDLNGGTTIHPNQWIYLPSAP